MDRVKRHITFEKWNDIRKLFQLTIEYTREAVRNGRRLKYSNAAQTVLYEEIGSMNTRERRLVLKALTGALSEQNLEQAADRMLIQDLRASL